MALEWVPFAVGFVILLIILATPTLIFPPIPKDPESENEEDIISEDQFALLKNECGMLPLPQYLLELKKKEMEQQGELKSEKDSSNITESDDEKNCLSNVYLEAERIANDDLNWETWEDRQARRQVKIYLVVGLLFQGWLMWACAFWAQCNLLVLPSPKDEVDN